MVKLGVGPEVVGFVAQLKLAHFLRGGQGELLQEVNVLGNLEPRNPILAIKRHIFRRDG